MSLIPLRKTVPSGAYETGLGDFDRIFDNLFRNALTNIAVPAAPAGGLALRMNIGETENAYHLEAELPGMEEKDVELTVKDGILTVSGEKSCEQESGNRKFHRVERSYGSFSRSVQLPADADESAIAAHMKNGVLSIDIAKRAEAADKPRRIEIGRK